MSASRLVSALMHLVEAGVGAPPLELVEPLAEAHQAMCRGAGQVELCRWRDTLLCNGEPVASTRAQHEQAEALLGCFDRAEIAGLRLERVELDDWVKLAHALSRGHAPAIAGVRVLTGSPRDPARARNEQARAIAHYARLTGCLRELVEETPSDREVSGRLVRRLRRAVQELVTLAEATSPSLPTLSVLARSHQKPWGRAGQLAVLTLVVARQLSLSRSALFELTAAALATGLATGAKPGWAPGVAADYAGVLAPSSQGTQVSAFEATWLIEAATCGELYGGAAPPSLAARLLHMSRGYLELLAPTGEGLRVSPAHALIELSSHHDKALVRLLARGLGWCQWARSSR